MRDFTQIPSDAEEQRCAAVLAAARGLFPGVQAGFGAALTAAAPEGLLAGESAGGPRVVPTRLAEFAAGRRAARAAMAALGLPPQPVPRGADRAPQWPAGLRGAITHADGLALAMVLAAPALASGADAGFAAPRGPDLPPGLRAADAGAAAAVSPGLDIEPDAPLPEELIPALLRPEEWQQIAQRPDALRLARLIFVAKEAGYKAQYPQSRTFLSFQDARVDLGQEGRFIITLLRRAGGYAAGLVFPGRYDFAAGLMLAGVMAPVPAVQEAKSCIAD